MEKAYHILVIEDDAAINHLLCELMTEAGYKVKAAYSVLTPYHQIKSRCHVPNNIIHLLLFIFFRNLLYNEDIFHIYPFHRLHNLKYVFE